MKKFSYLVLGAALAASFVIPSAQAQEMKPVAQVTIGIQVTSATGSVGVLGN